MTAPDYHDGQPCDGLTNLGSLCSSCADEPSEPNACPHLLHPGKPCAMCGGREPSSSTTPEGGTHA